MDNTEKNIWYNKRGKLITIECYSGDFLIRKQQATNKEEQRHMKSIYPLYQRRYVWCAFIAMTNIYQ